MGLAHELTMIKMALKHTLKGGSGMSLDIILFVVFLVLKLTNVIAWSWWWVTSPLWISAVIGAGAHVHSRAYSQLSQNGLQAARK